MTSPRGGARPGSGPKPKRATGAGVILAGRIDAQVAERFKARAAALGLSVSALLERAARAYLEREG